MKALQFYCASVRITVSSEVALQVDLLSGLHVSHKSVEMSQVLVLGAGVAGLAAIQTAKGLGAVVSAYDVRAAAKEQVLISFV